MNDCFFKFLCQRYALKSCEAKGKVRCCVGNSSVNDSNSSAGAVLERKRAAFVNIFQHSNETN